MSLAHVDEESQSFVYALHSPDVIWGLLRLEMSVLCPLDQITSQSHTRHIRQISTREDFRGWGFFKIVMERLVEMAEESGVFLHGVSSPFILKWPDIDTSEEFIWFVENERKFFADHRSWKEQRNRSRKLLKKYQEYGCCRFRYPQGNGFARRWMRNNSGFGYMSSECDETVSKVLENYLSC